MSKETERVLDFYSKRDRAAREEMALENTIFSQQQRARDVALAVAKQYQRLKDKRAYYSVQAAILYMQLSPSEKKEVTQAWKQSREAQRKQKSTGLRGNIKITVNSATSAERSRENE